MNGGKAGGAVWNALIRTHHITSRRKIAKLKQASNEHGVFVLLNTGRPPGIMYVEGSQPGVEEWVDVVQRLRYKDYQVAARPAPLAKDAADAADASLAGDNWENSFTSGLSETESVRDFARQMERRGVLEWWRNAMGYSGKGESP